MNRNTLFVLLLSACGAVESGGPPDVIDHAGPDGGSSPDPIPNVAPTVVAVDPPSGSVVTEDVEVAFTFSEPMDRAAVEAAITFPGATAPSFEWNQDGTEVTASRRVPYPQGSDPDQVALREFQVALAAGASDLEGDELDDGAKLLDYTLRYKRITTPFPFSQTLSGNCFESCAGTWTWFAAGERSADPTVATRGYLTVPFDLPDAIDIEHAELSTEIEQVIDNPFSSGDLMIDHVVFDAITAQLYSQRGVELGVLYARVPTPAVGDAVQLDVTDRFISDYENRVERNYRTQYRIRFPHDLSEDPAYSVYHSDGSWDVLELLRDETRVSVTYLIE